MLKAKDSFKLDRFMSDEYKIKKTERKNICKLPKLGVTCSIFFLSASTLEIYLIWR